LDYRSDKSVRAAAGATSGRRRRDMERSEGLVRSDGTHWWLLTP